MARKPPVLIVECLWTSRPGFAICRGVPESPTLQDVADKLGIHRTTVSLALRDYPRLALATRRKVQETARKMGYRPNPLVTALMRSRRSGKSVKHVVLAYVTCHPTRYGWRPPETVQPDFFPGAVARAKELGYKLEHFWLTEPGMTPQRFSDILTSRGINGLLIGRLPAGVHQMSLDWSRFCSVAMGLTLETPILHHVGEDHYYTTQFAMGRAISRGYQRIGFAFTTPNDYPRVGDRWLGGYLAQQMHLRRPDRLPPYQEGPNNQKKFLEWYFKWKPDALLLTRAQPARDWLTEAGVRVPRDVGLVELRNENLALGHSGVHHPPTKIGALGAEMLIGLLHRGETGIPTEPHEVLLAGHWAEGNTLPSR